MKRNNRGFTLAELLIAAAVIAVLVAVCIPVFTNMLEKAREATDLANVRSAYAEVKAAVMTDDRGNSSYNSLQQTYRVNVPLTQKKNGWTTGGVLNVGGITSDDTNYWQGSPKAGGVCSVYYDEQQEQVTINWSGYTLVTGLQWKISNGSVTQSGYAEVNSRWVCNALSDMIETTSEEGQTLDIRGISQDSAPNMQAALNSGYTFEVGVFLTDSNGKIIVDTGGVRIGGSNSSISMYPSDYIGKKAANSSANAYVYGSDYTDGSDLKIAVQFFKVKPGRTGSVALSASEAQEFENLISFSAGN